MKMAARGELQFVAALVLRSAGLAPGGALAESAAALAQAASQQAEQPNAQLRAAVEAVEGPKELKQALQMRWLGRSADEQARVAQWLSVKAAQGNAEDSDEVLAAMDAELRERTFLATQLQPSLADAAMFWAMRDAISAKTADAAPAAARWFNSLQADEDVQDAAGDSLKKVVFPTAAFDALAKIPAAKAPAAKAPAANSQPKDANNDKKNAAKKNDGKKNDAKKNDGKKNEAKKNDAKKEEAPAAAGDDGAIVTKLDIRVGKVVKCWNHEGSDKLFCEHIDVGEGEPRPIASGLRAFYSDASQIEGRLVLVLCNLKPRPLAGFTSNGMVLCASNADKSKVEIVDVPEGAQIGERVTFEGIEMTDAASPAQVKKKKIFEAVAPNLKTTEGKAPCWVDEEGKEHIFLTSKGACSVPTISKGTVS